MHFDTVVKNNMFVNQFEKAIQNLNKAFFVILIVLFHVRNEAYSDLKPGVDSIKNSLCNLQV